MRDSPVIKKAKEELEALIVAAIKPNVTYIDVAKQFNVSDSYVGRIARAHNLPARWQVRKKQPHEEYKTPPELPLCHKLHVDDIKFLRSMQESYSALNYARHVLTDSTSILEHVLVSIKELTKKIDNEDS